MTRDIAVDAGLDRWWRSSAARSIFSLAIVVIARPVRASIWLVTVDIRRRTRSGAATTLSAVVRS